MTPLPSELLDEKGLASRTFADVVTATADLFPDPAYRPKHGRIHPGMHGIYAKADGIGTKPELAERLFDGDQNHAHFETLAHDVVAMVADDASRDGEFVLGIVNSDDVNTAEDQDFIAALARGMESACRKGRFPLLNGETAELGYRSPGIGASRVNWNAVAITLLNEKKVIDGSNLCVGQPVVALRETSIRSNGLTRARAILERAHMMQTEGTHNKRHYIMSTMRRRLGYTIPEHEILQVLDQTPVGEGLWEHIHLPWHKTFPALTEKLLQPSTIYTPLIYEAQGGVDGEQQIPLVACAHVSGGGVPLKASRMLKQSGLGLYLEPVFPDPDGVPELLDLAQRYVKDGAPLVDDRTACTQWNRGVGFLCVTHDFQDADALVELATRMGYEAKVAGEITDLQAIEFRGHCWTY